MILDTNALSALADGDEAFESIAIGSELIAVPVIVVGEYRYGISQSRHRLKYESWLESLLRDCRLL